MSTETHTSAYEAGLVRLYKGDKVIGAGVYVQNGYVLTCAHVVAESLGLGKKLQRVKLDSVADKSVKLDFPFFPKGQPQDAKVEPALWRSNDEDLAILKLTEAVPEGVTPPPFTESTDYGSHTYQIYGFPDGHTSGVWSEGKFVGKIASERVQLEGIQTQGIAIEPGFSGAPVWNEVLGAIAGITVARDQSREEAKVSFMIPYQKLKPALQAIALFELLRPESTNLASHWQTAYRLLRPDYSTEAQPTNLEEAIVQIQDLSAQGSTFSPMEQFIGYLAQQELGLSIQPRLIQWLTKQGKDVNALLQQVKQKVDQKQAKQPVGQAPHLLFWVQAELNSDRYSVQAYLVSDREHYDPLQATQLKAPADYLEQSQDGKVDQREIAGILRACIYECGRKLEDIRKLRLEVFLPLEHLNWNVDRWTATDDSEPELIGCRYQVAIRLSHRWETSHTQYRGDWDAKWVTLKTISDRQAYKSLVCGNGQKLKKVRQLLRQPEVIGLVLTQYLSDNAEDIANPMIALLHAGSPVAIWPRQRFDGSEEQFKQLLLGSPLEFDQLMTFTADGCSEGDEQVQCSGILGCYLSHMPENIRACREQIDLECDEGETHIGHHIGFIWEDPKLVPPIAAFAPRLKMSAMSA